MGVGGRTWSPPRRPKDGESRSVSARSETWRLTFWRGGASVQGEPAEDAVSIELERHGHNFPASMTAKEAAGLIDALLELLPEARGHMTAETGRRPGRVHRATQREEAP